MLSVLGAAEITIDQTVVTIPKDNRYQTLPHENALVKMLKQYLPNDYNVHYVELFIHKDKEQQQTKGFAYNVLLSVSELDSEIFSKEEFIESKNEIADGIKEELEQVTSDEAFELLRRSLAQRLQNEIEIQNPTLLGDIEITNENVTYTAIMPMTFGADKKTLLMRATVRLIMGKYTIFISYRELKQKESINLLAQNHTDFVNRVSTRNSLILPNGPDDSPTAVYQDDDPDANNENHIVSEEEENNALYEPFVP